MYVDCVKDSGEIILFLTNDDGKHLTAFHPYCKGESDMRMMKEGLEKALEDSPTIIAEETHNYIQHYMVGANGLKWGIGPCVDRASAKRIGDRLRGYFRTPATGE